MIRVDFGGLGEAKERIEGMPGAFDRAIARAAQDVFDRVEESVSQHNKPGADHGALLDSLYLQKDGDAYEVGHDLSRAPHALFVHWGTRPHIIKPKNKKSLRWVTGAGGGTSFTFSKGVNHPGYEGDPWMIEAAREVPAIFEKRVRQLLED